MSAPSEKPVIRLFHQLARTGGTLISRCLGCMDEITLLSEIHPFGSKVHNPLEQAHKWFQLFSKEDIDNIASHPHAYVDAIQLIHDRATEAGKTLVIRDWTHIDFTGIPFTDTPTYSLLNVELLSERFTVLSYASVRHPIDQWLSLSKLSMYIGNQKLTIAHFMRGYLAFAKLAKQMGYIKYEDFAKHSDTALTDLCTGLELNFDSNYLDNWSTYSTITGDNTTSSQSRFSKRTTIESTQATPVRASLLDQFTSNQDFIDSIEILDYPIYWVTLP